MWSATSCDSVLYVMRVAGGVGLLSIHELLLSTHHAVSLSVYERERHHVCCCHPIMIQSLLIIPVKNDCVNVGGIVSFSALQCRFNERHCVVEGIRCHDCNETSNSVHILLVLLILVLLQSSVGDIYNSHAPWLVWRTLALIAISLTELNEPSDVDNCILITSIMYSLPHTHHLCSHTQHDTVR
jgi:hypothetical protein